ncbi:PspC domain-containing protein [Prauserella alba]|nr:PspC domain-containing protein [Prauserella alba]MCP2182591.1 phage shock protein C (PspC) family protein [Prauserella alba]
MNSTSGATRHLDGFEATVKDFWASRPRRPAQGRKIAGVAAGIGLRYGIDPIVIRVALVALTFFGGVGPAVYLLGWLFLPGTDDEVSPFESLLGHGGSATSKALTLLLCAACFPAFGLAFGGTWLDGGGLVGMALVVTALYLLHRGRGHLRRPDAAGAGTLGDRTAPEPGTRVDTATADWDALGASPLGWHLADPSTPVASAPPPEEPERPPRERPRRRRCVSKVTLVTLALAVIAGAVGTPLALTEAGWSLSLTAGIVLAILGAGMVTGAFVGGGRGLIWWAMPTAAVGLLLATVPVQDYSGGPGEISATPTSAEAVQQRYERTMGQIRLDLRHIADPDADVATTARVGAGDIEVLVPDTADVTFECSAHTGTADCLTRSSSGVARDRIAGSDDGTDGPGGQRIELVLDAGIGNVEVHRGG